MRPTMKVIYERKRNKTKKGDRYKERKKIKRIGGKQRAKKSGFREERAE